MTGTNRVLNRVILALAGLLLAVIGAAALAVAVMPDGSDRWADLRTFVDDGVRRAWGWRGDLSGIGLGTAPWALVLVPLAALLLVALLVVFVVAQGRGRVQDVVADRRLPKAQTVASYSVDVAVAQDLVRDAVHGSDAVDAVRVTAYRIRTGRALRVVAGVRRGAAATRAVQAVQQGLLLWDDLADDRLPTVLHVVRGGGSVRAARPVTTTVGPVRADDGATPGRRARE